MNDAYLPEVTNAVKLLKARMRERLEEGDLEGVLGLADELLCNRLIQAGDPKIEMKLISELRSARKKAQAKEEKAEPRNDLREWVKRNVG